MVVNQEGSRHCCLYSAYCVLPSAHLFSGACEYMCRTVLLHARKLVLVGYEGGPVCLKGLLPAGEPVPRVGAITACFNHVPDRLSHSIS